VTKEKELGLHRNLIVMNMGSLTYGFSFIIIQQPLCLISSLFGMIALSFCQKVGDAGVLAQVYLGVLALSEEMMLFSLCLTTLFKDSK
jgi:hypothetical protein